MADYDLNTYPFAQFLKEFPTGVFEAELARTPLSAFQQQTLRPRYADFANQYQGALATQAQQGILPTMSFQDYLRSLDPYAEFFRRFSSPESRGTLTRNPYTQFRFR